MQGSLYYFLLSAFVVAAALWKHDAPLIPIALGIGVAGFWTWFRKRRSKAR